MPEKIWVLGAGGGACRSHPVKVEVVGCIKRCDSAPNLMVIPPQPDSQGKTPGQIHKTKTYHGNVKRQQIPALPDRPGKTGLLTDS